MAQEPRNHVYFVQAILPDGLIKIGWTSNLRSRIQSLSTGSPVPLKVLLVIEGSRETEQRLHIAFAEFRAHGEWFRPSEALLAHIKRLSTPPPPVESQGPQRDDDRTQMFRELTAKLEAWQARKLQSEGIRVIEVAD